MPVKRTTAAKKAVAKKTTPAKSAAPALAKEVARKKTAAKTSASASAEPAKNIEQLTKNIAAAIEGGQFDSHISLLDNAITKRINAHVASTAKTAAAKPAPKSETKKVSTAPKRAKKPVENIVPESGKTYKLAAPAKLEGAKVKFIRPKADDDAKVVIEMVTEKPGYPKGKRVVVPVSALRKV
jgi:hypothetical protein